MDRTDRYLAAPWDTYTPTWTAATTNPALNNGTMLAGFRLDGTTLHIRGFISIGSTTTKGSGRWAVGLPSGLVAAGPTSLSAWTFDASSFANGILVGIVGNGVGYVTFASGSGLIGSTTPFTWATDDQLCWGGTIEVQA